MRAAPDLIESPGRLRAVELTPSRWSDFESLFEKYHGVQAGCWCMFYHREAPNGPLESVTRPEVNRRDHRELLNRGHANGIVVYRDRVPIGWCQFGRRADLPRVEKGRKYRALSGGLDGFPEWRITCFFVDKPHRRTGVAAVALHAALDAIGRRGGGIVEAYPATRGRAVATWFGSAEMFAREGFTVVRPFGTSNLLVRKRVPPARRRGRGRALTPRRGRGRDPGSSAGVLVEGPSRGTRRAT